MTLGIKGSQETRSQGFIAATQQIIVGSGIETNLQHVGINNPDQLADAAMLQTRLLSNNPCEVMRLDACKIYLAALRTIPVSIKKGH